MRRKIVAFLVCMMVAIGSLFTVGASMRIEKKRSVTQSSGSQQVQNTLIAELHGDRVIEVDSSGTIVWEYFILLKMPVDAERLANGNTLIADLGNNRVIEVDTGGTIVWEYTTGLYDPFDVERLANGNTLIADTYNFRVIEVDSGGTIVWEKSVSSLATDAERLANGNTLITDLYVGSVIEVDSSGNIVWAKTGLNFPVDAERLSNGNTLITEWLGNRVIEVDSGGAIVWEYISGLGFTFDAERFANGNTLITEYYYGNRVIEVDSSGTIVWQKTGLNGPTDAERISNPPGMSTVSGKTSGKAGVEYEYTFNAVDPDGDDVRYIIDWGDNTSNMTVFNPSGTDIIVSHTWSNDGTYNITAKAQDVYGLEGPEGTLTVTIPRDRSVYQPLLLRFLDRFPLLEKLLGLIKAI